MKNSGIKCVSVLSFFVLAVLLHSSVSIAQCKPGKRRFKVRAKAISVLHGDKRSVVPGYRKLKHASILDLADFHQKRFRLKARFRQKQRCRVRSVDFSLSGSLEGRRHLNKPYIFNQNPGTRESDWLSQPGRYVLEVVPRSRKNGKGRRGRPYTIAFTLIDSSVPGPVQPPVPTPPEQAPAVLCSAGGNISTRSDSKSVPLRAVCNSNDLTSVSWQQRSGPNDLVFSDSHSLNPDVSGFVPGRYVLDLSITHSEGTFRDSIQLAVMKQKGNYDFSYALAGPMHVVAGHPLFLDIAATTLRGGRDFMYVSASGLPLGAALDIPVWRESCCSNTAGEQYGWDVRDVVLRLDTSRDTPPGEYSIVFTVASGGISKHIQRTVVVDPVPVPLERHAVDQVPAIPRLHDWEQNMQTFGALWCEDPAQQSLWEGNVWYYDGTKVFYEIADYTGNNYWRSQCLKQTVSLYRNFVESAQPGVQGWRVFPHGLYRHYIETSKAWILENILRLSDNSVWTFSGGGVHPDLMRETAYLIHAYLFREKIGFGEHPNLEQSVAFAIGQLEQVRTGGTSLTVKPFMLGLAFEALIHYYEVTADERAATAIKEAADWLWFESGLWHDTAKAFLYVNKHIAGDDPPLPAADLSLLIAPAYAWLYHRTGLPQYQQIADAIFQGGVSKDFDADGFYEHGACLACTGKIFSQNYRWSFDFVRWRQSPPR